MKKQKALISGHLVAKINEKLPMLNASKRDISAQFFLPPLLMFLALLVSLALAPLGTGLQYMTFLPAVAISAFFGGYRAGLFATAIGLLIAPYALSVSIEALKSSPSYNLLFLFNAVLLSFAFELMHRLRTHLYRDLQLAKKSEDLLKQHKQLLENSDDGFWIVDTKGYIIESNQGYACISGYSIAELAGMHVNHLETKENFHDLQDRMLIIRSQGNDQFETRHRHKQGREIILRVNVNYLPETQRLFVSLQDITAHKHLAEDFEQAKQLMDSVVNNIPAMVSLKRASDLRFAMVNVTGEELLGHPEHDLLEKTDYDIFPQEQAYYLTSVDRQVLKLHGVLDVPREKLITTQGDTHYLYTRRVVLKGSENKPTYLLNISIDMTELQKAEEALRIAEITFETHEAIMVNDANGNIIRVNQAFQQITGYSAEELLGKNPRIFNSGRHDASFFTKMWQQLLEKGHWSGEVWNRRKSGQIYPKSLTIKALRDNANETTGFVTIFSDISKHQVAENEGLSLAFYDPLTKLPNRRLLIDRCQEALKISDRKKQFGAMLYLDMSNLKMLNDTQGHDYGDMLLIEVAQRIKYIIRASDSVARFGDDEFAVLVEDLSNNGEEASQKVALIAEKIRAALAVAYHIRGSVQHSSPSIGVCLFSTSDLSVNDILERAEIAMNQAKSSGRNAVRIYDPVMQKIGELRTAMEAELRQAFDHRELQLHYQIQMGHDESLLGAEALIRWQHPVLGMLTASQFIPLAEESSLILDIDLWVLDNACRQLAIWSTNELTSHLTLAINISMHQFRMLNFVDLVTTTLHMHNIDASRLTLEFTESIVIDDIDAVIQKLLALQALGVKLSLDNFCTRYSSLSYLKQLPIHQIKIDQHFIRDIVTDPIAAVMVRTIIDMAKNLHMHVIAEGVETEAQFEFLKAHVCEAYQGFLFSKPVPLDSFEKLLTLEDIF